MESACEFAREFFEVSGDGAAEVVVPLVVVLVPLAAILIFRMLGKTKRTKRPVHSFRIGTK